MIKEGRKPSNDPVQEKLRENKAQWNKSVSELIGDLINFKKLMNGSPSKFNMERSTIKEPIPSDPAAIIGVLAGDFQELAQKANAIIAQQIEYSKNRKKKQIKSPSPASPSLSQQLTATTSYDLMALGSSPLSRFLSKMKGPWFSGDGLREKQYRVSLLTACADLHSDLKKFEELILGSSPETIFSASKIMNKIEKQLNFIHSALKAFEKIDLNIELPVDSIPDGLDDFISDFKENHDKLNLDSGKVLNISTLLSRIENGEAPAGTEVYFVRAYKSLLDDYNKNHQTSYKTLAEAVEQKHLEKQADFSLSKWINKIKHKLSPFDKTSALRLDIVNHCSNGLKTLNKIMNSLEKEIDSELLTKNISALGVDILKIKQLLKPLEDIIQNNIFDKTFMDLLKNKNLTEYDFNLDGDQKKKLEGLLQKRKFHQISNLYTERV